MKNKKRKVISPNFNKNPNRAKKLLEDEKEARDYYRNDNHKEGLDLYMIDSEAKQAQEVRDNPEKYEVSSE